MLRTELNELESERTHAQTDESDETGRTRQLALLNGGFGALNQRIATAKVVNVHEQPQNEVRFGATVSLYNRNANIGVTKRQLTIVGVDEADAAQGRIAFTAPIARLLLGKHVGDSIPLRTAQGDNVMDIMAISYEA